MFFRGSRYEPVETATLETADGREVRYKRLRFVVRDAAPIAYVSCVFLRPSLSGRL